MDIQRAKEIAVSPEMKDVRHDGVAIYIQHVNEANETARIFPLDEPQNEKTVPLQALKEQ